MSLALIRRAFEQRLATWAAGKGFPVAYQNVAFSPPDTTYIRAFLVPNEMASEDLAGRHRRFQGFFQASIVLPINGGAGEGEALVAELDALFPMSAPITVSGLKVYLTRPMGAGPALSEADRYVIPVAANYRADTIS